MTTYGYARISTYSEPLDAQLEGLRAAGCGKIFREKVSGAKADRAELTKLLATLREGDVVIVSRLDRLARSTRELLEIVDSLDEHGAAFRSLGEPWADTTTPHGRLILPVLSGLAEFERGLIRARTGEGREREQARGQRMGRPPTLTARQRAEAREALKAGAATQAELARRFAVSQSTISRLAEKTPAPAPVKRLDADTERAARAFLKRLKGKYPVIEGIVYGSRARGDHRPDSDADVAVILGGARGDRYDFAREFAGIEFNVMLETGILVQAVPIWEEEMAHPELFTNPALIANIKREGLRL